jgi:hypothetical protein
MTKPQTPPDKSTHHGEFTIAEQKLRNWCLNLGASLELGTWNFEL